MGNRSEWHPKGPTISKKWADFNFGAGFIATKLWGFTQFSECLPQARKP